MIIYLCNALDEETKNLRAITTDSPAATKKVFGLCHALRVSDMDTIVLSMGRGRQNGSGVRFPRLRKKVGGVQVSYAAFWHIALLTHIVTALSLMLIMGSLARKGKPVLLVYNRCWHYIPALCLAKLFRARCFLDLEDGWVGYKQSLAQRMLTAFFDWVCDSGSVLACESLADQVKTQNSLACYGAASVPEKIRRQWHAKSLQVVFGGSLCEGTGAKLFIQAIEVFIQKYPSSRGALHVVVVGFGDMTKELELFAVNKTDGMVEFRGSVSNSDYAELLDDSHIGLCLKLASGPFHDSTFPSKVIELSSQGLLLLSTSVSDVPKLFSSENALLLSSDSPEVLADAWYWAITHRNEAALMANRGCDMILRRCSLESVGSELADFLCEDKPL